MYSNFAPAPTGGGVALAATLTSGTAAAVMQTPAGTQVPPAPQGVIIRGFINVTAGATAGGYTLKMFRGAGISGTQVGNTDTVQTIVSVAQTFYYSFTDLTPGGAGVAPGVYTLSVTAAGANGTFNDGCIEVVVPDPGGSDT